MIEYRPHTDQGKPGFAHVETDYSIVTEYGERGRWLGIYPDPVQPGDKIRITCGLEAIADVVITFWSGHPGATTYLGSQALSHKPEVDEIVIIPNNAVLFRVELRNWGVGFAKFIDVQIEYPYEEPIVPPVDPPPDPPPIEKPHWAVYHCPSPSGDVVWTVTVSEDSGSISKGLPFAYVDEMAATEPDEPAELVPPGNMDDW